MPHLLVLTSTFPRWENDSQPPFVYELSKRLTDHFDVTVLTPRTSQSQKREFMAGISVIRFPYFFQKWETLTSHDGGIMNRLKYYPLSYLLVPFFILGQLWALNFLLRREKIDIIHAHWITPQGLVATIAMMFSRQSIPLIGTSHGGDLYALQGSVFQKLKIWVIRRMARLTVVSHAMKQTVIDMGIHPRKIEVLSMGVDLKNLFIPNPDVAGKPGNLLFVGRLVEKKGLHVLIHAMPRILHRFPEALLTVAGTGPLEKDLRSLAYFLGVSDKIIFKGMVKQSKLPELYQQATLAVFPFVVEKSGDQEGLGLVVVEAMGCGCPVIASDLPAVKDTVQHGKTGWTVTPGDSYALADRIIMSLENSKKMKKMAEHARHRAIELFDWERITDRYKLCINSVLKSRS
jgi:glycosyltransferase involved in cell wall biosynthesis